MLISWLGVWETLAAAATYTSVLLSGGWHFGVPLAADDPLYRAATTATLVGIVLAQMANLLACRDERHSAFAPGRPRNPLLLHALVLEAALILSIVYTTPGRTVFGTEPLGPLPWVIGAGGAILFLLAEEARKAILRGRRGGARS